MSDRKRGREEDAPPRKRTSNANQMQMYDEEDPVDDFEDPFEDEIEEEEIITEAEADDLMEDEEEDEEEEIRKNTMVWRPNVDTLEEGDTLEHDNSAYDLYHVLRSDWPCLSLDIIPDKLGHMRTNYPHTMYFVSGTQAADRKENKITVFKASDLHRTKHDDDSDDSDDDYLDDDPIVESKFVKHNGCVNRIRVMPQRPNIVASWSDVGEVYVWDLGEHIKSLDTPQRVANIEPIKTFKKHADEGYAMDWSSVTEGRLLTGDCKKNIYLWNAHQASWEIDTTPYTAHRSSVEDIQWSPNEGNVFASCSSDKTIRIWDVRKKGQSALSIEAHSSDVNVISWNRKAGHALLSGSDDGVIRAWDLRKFEANSPTASFTWHKAPITSVKWSPFEGPVLAASSADNQITIWDLSLEADKEVDSQLAPTVDVPAQLLFVHQGQNDPKEICWHPQIPGMLVSTGADGFNVFKTINS